MKKFFSVLLWLLYCGGTLHLSAAPSPWDSWRSGYTSCEQAERQFERGNYTEALSLFEKSKKHYLDVRSARPDWNQRVIAERIGECDRRINEVRRLLGAGKVKKRSAVAAVPGTAPKSAEKELKPGDTVIFTPAGAQVETSEESIDSAAVLELRAALARSNAELERNKKSMISMRTRLLELQSEADSLKKSREAQRNFEREIANLVRDRRIALEKYALLEARLKKMEADSAKPNEQLEVLQNRLLEERMVLERERKRAAEAETALQNAEERARQNQLARTAAEKVLFKEKQQYEKLSGDMAVLQNRLQDSNSRIRELTGELERSRKQSAELTEALKKGTSSKDEALAGAKTAEAGKRAAEAALKTAEAEKRAAENARQSAEANKRAAEAALKAVEAEKRAAETARKKAEALARENASAARAAAEKLAREQQLARESAAADKTAAEKLLREQQQALDNAVAARTAAEKLSREHLIARQSAEAEKAIAVAEKNVAVAEKNTALAEKNAAVAEKNAAVSARDAAVAEKVSAASARDAAMALIADLRKDVADKESRINSAEQEKSRSAAQIAALNEEIRRNQEHLNSMKAEFERGRAALERSINDAESLRKRNSGLEDDIKALAGRNAALTKRLETRDSADFRDAAAARETCRKLEKDLLTLQNELVVIRNNSNTANSRIADFERKLKSADAELKETRRRELALTAVRDQQSAEIKRLKEIESEFDELKRNFEALSSENRENRALLAAAKPREKELAHVKLRLLELDRLKAALTREQQLNEELRAESRRLAGEVKTLRSRTAELDTARRRIAELEGSRRELEQLKNVQKEYLRLAAIEPELAKLKIRSGELEVQLKERRSQITQLREELQNSAKKYTDLEKQLTSQQNNLKRIQELEAMISTQNTELDHVNSMLKRLQAGDNSVMPAEYRRQIDDLRRTASTLGPLNDRLNRLQKEYDSMKTQFADRIAKLHARCESAEEFGRRRSEEINMLRKLNADLAEMNRNSSAALKNKVDQAQLDRLNAEIAAMNKLYTEVTAERDRLNSELDAFRRGAAPETLAVKIEESPEELSGAGLVAERNGNLELAIWNYRQALLADENFLPAHLRLGHILYNRRDYAGALPHLSAARTGSKFSLELALKTARCQIALKRFGNAKSIIDPLLKTHADNSQVQLIAGLIESGSGSARTAEERMITAIRLAPADPENMIELARLLADSAVDRKGEAVRYYERARAVGANPEPELEKKLSSLLDSRREMIRFLSGAASEAEIGRDHNSAVWYYRKLVEMKPDEYTPRLALALHRSGHSARARETLEFNKPTRLGMVVLTIIENDSGNETAALRAARQSAGAKLPEDWQALTMEIVKLKSLRRPSAAIRMLLSNSAM